MVSSDFDSGDNEKSLIEGYVSHVPGLRSN